MSAWPDATTVERFLIRVRQRIMLVRLLEGVAVGFGLATLFALAGARAQAALAALVIVPALLRMALGDQWRFGWWRALPMVAEHLERRTTKLRNLLVTASEVMSGTRSYVNDAVMARAACLVEEIEPRVLYPVRGAAITVAVTALALTALVMRPGVVGSVAQVLPFSQGTPAVRRVHVTVTPPQYSGLSQTTSIDPTRIDAWVGSRIDVSVEASAASVTLETLAGMQAMQTEGGVFRTTLNATTDGFLAIEPRDSTGRTGARQLIGLTVALDGAPSVSLTAPGRDLFFATVPDTLSVAINASDDLALLSLALKYTTVSGSGERFTFTEREVPLTVTRTDARSWSARGTWRLDQLDLTPGDMVVYRAVATDKRPGAAPVESDSYVLEVVTPGAIAAEGFAADDQRDRYAVSQQMVILKTERLIARRASLNTDSLSYESRTLAAEQRQVRAEFVFMMGGELEDIAGEASGTLELNEVAEAEAEGDILAGRLANQGRLDMTRALRAMSRASTSLNESSLDEALRAERAALDNLMRAFARSRFILRALTQRERIDLERRLSGSLSLTGGLRGPTAESAPDLRTVALRRLMADVAAGDSVAIRTSAMALLRQDPGSSLVRLLVARAQERGARDSLVKQLSDVIAGAVPMSPLFVTPRAADLLEGALREVSRREVRRP